MRPETIRVSVSSPSFITLSGPYHQAMPCPIEPIAIYRKPVNSIRSLSFSISSKQAHNCRLWLVVWEEKPLSEIESCCSVNEVFANGATIFGYLLHFLLALLFFLFSFVLIRRMFSCFCFPSIIRLCPFEVLLELDFYLFCSRGFHYLLFISGKEKTQDSSE